MRPIQKVAVLLGFLTIPLNALAAQAPDEAFFPMQKGATWVYDTINKKKDKHFDMKVVIDGPWK